MANGLLCPSDRHGGHVLVVLLVPGAEIAFRRAFGKRNPVPRVVHRVASTAARATRALSSSHGLPNSSILDDLTRSGEQKWLAVRDASHQNSVSVPRPRSNQQIGAAQQGIRNLFQQQAGLGAVLSKWARMRATGHSRPIARLSTSQGLRLQGAASNTYPTKCKTYAFT